MPFVSVSDELLNKAFTSVENKFITKYMPVLEPNAVKIYMFSLYLCQNGMTSYSIEDMAKALSLTVEEVKSYYEYLEEFELISIISLAPFEIKISDVENVYGKPKKLKPEKYADFTKSIQSIIKGRMISTSEFREYFLLIEDYGFEQNALLMIINYCVNLKGENIRLQYIKKVAKSFAEEGATTAVKVEKKLSAYTASTPALLRIFTESGINKQPDIDDDRLYKKWTAELGFDDKAITYAAKNFKAKTVEKLDAALEELYKNKKFDVKEIEDYCKSKNSVYSATIDIARALGVYMQTSAPYIENYVNVWYNYGYSLSTLKTLANYCFKQGKNSFGEMDTVIVKLYDEGIVSDSSVNDYIEKSYAEEAFIKTILETCGLTRKVIAWDKDCLKRWRSWNFSDEMLIEAAKVSFGKSNPMAYMNGVLSSWKSDNIFSTDKISANVIKPNQTDRKTDNAVIERHYSDLRHAAEDKAEKNLQRATADRQYGEIYSKLKELSIELAFAEICDTKKAESISEQINNLEIKGDARLSELGISKDDFVPHYVCKKCNDTGFDKNGNPCDCMKKFISSL